MNLMPRLRPPDSRIRRPWHESRKKAHQQAVRRASAAIIALLIVLALGGALCEAALAAPINHKVPPIAGPRAVSGATSGWSQVWSTSAARDGYLVDIDFVDDSYGWAAGYGTVLATTDGGTTWTEQAVPQGTGQLWAVHFCDRLHGWAAGRGVILGTSNGGATWTAQYTETMVDFVSLDCVDATHAWAVGQTLQDVDGTLTTYSDGPVQIMSTANGSSWSAQTTDATGYVYGLDFVDRDYGWIMTGSFAKGAPEGVVLATTNGGSTWADQDLGAQTKPFDVFFLNRREGWALGYENDLLFHTTDGGTTWESWACGGFRCLDMVDSLHGFAAGLRFNADYTIKDSGLYRTANGGHTWTLDLARPVAETTNRIAFPDAAHGFAVTVTGVTYDPDTCAWSILRYAAGDTAPVNIATPALSGAAAVGKTLSCSAGTWTGSPKPSLSYLWRRDGSAITGAASASHLVVAADCGHALTCTVTARNSAGFASVTSNALKVPVAAHAPVLIKVSPKAGGAACTVVLSGKRFGAKRGTGKVLFGKLAVRRYLSWSATRIKVLLPAVKHGKMAVKVKTAAGVSNIRYFTRR